MPPRRDPIVRFWEKVNKNGPVPPKHPELGPCWLWTAAEYGGHAATGRYGAFWTGERQTYAHRFAFELLVGPIPEDLEPDHLCEVKKCVRPDHIELATSATNHQRSNSVSGQASRATRCPQGHPYAGDNLVVRKNGVRTCRTCVNEQMRARRARKTITHTEADPNPRYPNSLKTHCKRGHPYEGDNLIVTKDGTRKCRICVNELQNAARIRRIS